MTKVAKIPESFVKAYVKANGEIDEVNVEYCCQRCGVSNNKHKMSCKDSHLWIQVPKLRDDNTVIIYQAKTTYSREDLKKLWDNHPRVDYITDTKLSDLLFEKWIKENL